MKEKLVCLLMLLCSISLFTACSSDDEPAYPIDQEIAGTYKGALNIKLGGIEGEYNLPKNVTMTAAGKNLVNLEIKKFSFGALNLGTITLTNCEIQKSGNSYTFATTQTLTLANPIGACPVTASGTITDGKLDANIDVTVPALNQTVKVKCQGSKLKGNESSEAKITGFTFDSPVVTAQPVIDEANGTITFKVSEQATSSDLRLTPSITISDKATVNPATGVVQDFSGSTPVVYTVVAEDGTIKTYSVSISGRQAVLKYSFEEWVLEPGNSIANEYSKPQPIAELATSAEGAAMLKFMGITDMPVFKSTDKKEGTYAIKLVTMDTSEKASALVPAITSGSLFTGKFEMDFNNLQNKLTFTKFGIPYARKPLAFKGWYKYTPGAKFIDGSNISNIVTVPNKTDQCAIQAVLYKVTNDDEILTGVDINTSDKRVAVAQLGDGTAKAEYTYFNLPFQYLPGKTYEAGAKYKIAIVCSSSKEGDLFKGAGGSTLILDELEIVSE